MAKQKHLTNRIDPRFHRTDGLWGILPIVYRLTPWRSNPGPIARMSLKERNIYNNLFEVFYGKSAWAEFSKMQKGLAGASFEVAAKLVLSNAWKSGNPGFKAKLLAHLLAQFAYVTFNDVFFDILVKNAVDRVENLRLGNTTAAIGY